MSLHARLARTLDHVVSDAEFHSLLASDRQLRVKWGVDCTAPLLHLGHAVNLWMMRELQEAGHRVVLVLGDVTTAVGDPTGRSESRPVLPYDEITRNAEAFLEQVSIVLRTDDDLFEVRRNSEWYDDMAVPEWLRLMSEVTHAQLVARDMFRQRIADGREIGMHELCYPVLQGYDSVMIGADIAMAGSDQLFNEMLARPLQQRRGQPPQVVITSKITPGIDGRAKQSKSLGNFIALTDTARDKFGKAMSIPDELVADYMLVYTELPTSVAEQARSLRGPDVRDAKLRLANALVARYHGSAIADHEYDWFCTTFSHRRPADDLPIVRTYGISTVFELVRQARPELSGNEIRRLVSQGAVRLDDEPLTDPLAVPRDIDGAMLRVGKRHRFRLQVAGTSPQE